MSRFFVIKILILVAAGQLAAQASPTQPHYNVQNQHTYLLSPDGMTWQTARTYSRTLGGYLVSINTPAEQAFLNNEYNILNPPPYWIGLSDEVTEGIFAWDSGEQFTYSNFCMGEPNNFGGNEDYVTIFPNGFNCWNDDSSPNTSGNPTAHKAIIELPFGDRVSFESTPTTCGASPFPTPLGATTHPEGVSWNGAGGTARPPLVTSVVEDGFPVAGTKYFRMPAKGIFNGPVGGPALPRPAPPTLNEVRILIPPGTKGVSLAWEFISKESPNSASFNDGFDVSVVDPSGALIANVVYGDTEYVAGATSTGTFCVESGGTHRLVPGPKGASKVLPPLPFPSYLSIVCWNGGDDSLVSSVHVDAIQFWGSGEFNLKITAPTGAGSIQLQNSGGGPGNLYWTAVTLSHGSFPFGWLFGVDLSAADLITEVTSGVPFSGTLNASGSSTFTIPAGVPSGLELFAVSLQFQNSGPFGGQFMGASAPEYFLTP